VCNIYAYPSKRSHLVALRPTKVSANDLPAGWCQESVEK
jgi:hypothetical protein